MASTPMVHDEWGPSRHPALVKCPAYESTSGDSVHSVLGTWKHDQSYELWVSWKHDHNPKIDYRKHFEDAEKLLYECVGTELTWKEGGKKQTYVITANDCNHVCMGVEQLVNFYKWLIKKYPNEDFKDCCEELQPLKNLGLKKGGTPDVLFVGQSVAACMDYKYGQKIVTPWSEQLMSYLSGILSDNPFEEWTFYSGIIQPTVREDKAWVVEVSIEYVERHANMMIDIIEIARSPNPPRYANDNCVYCAKFDSCPVIAVRGQKAMTKMQGLDIERSTTDELGELFTMFGELKQLIGAVEKQMVLNLKEGQPSKNWQLVEGAKRRVWTDEGDAEDVLSKICEEKGIDKNDLYEMKFVSPAQAEKLVGKAKAVREAMQNVIMSKHGELKLGRKMDEE